MNSLPSHVRGVIVVDPQCEDYRPLVARTSLTFFTTGDEALRACRGLSPKIWMVNVRLADITGVGLVKLIRARQRRAVIYVVGDVYSLEDELAARAGGATAYVCKPVSVAWLQGREPRGRRPAIRAGPAAFP